MMLLKVGMLGAVVLADTASGIPQLGIPQLPAVANYGLLGALTMALISQKFLVPKWTYDKEVSRADRAEAAAERLHLVAEDRQIPALTEATLAIRDTSALINDLKRELDRLRDQLDDQRRKRD